MRTLSKRQSALLVAFLVVVWGANWPLTKFAISFMPPILLSGVRTMLGGLLLLAVAIPRADRLRFKETYPIYLVSAVVNVVFYYGFQTVGLSRLPSGLFAAIVFLQPVFVGIFASIWLGESMHRGKRAGLFLGFAGVGVIMGGSGGLSGHISGSGVALAVCTALSWALGTVYVKKYGPRVDPIWLVGLQLSIGGGVMTAAGSGVERWSDVVWDPSFVATLLFISVFVIALGWLAFYKLIESGEAGTVASYTFLIPVAAVAMGTVFLHEPFTLSLLAGLLLIAGGIALVNRKAPGARAKPESSG